MGTPKHPNTTKGSLSVTLSETAKRFRRQVVKGNRRQGKCQIREDLTKYFEGRTTATSTF